MSSCLRTFQTNGEPFANRWILLPPVNCGHLKRSVRWSHKEATRLKGWTSFTGRVSDYCESRWRLQLPVWLSGAKARPKFGSKVWISNQRVRLAEIRRMSLRNWLKILIKFFKKEEEQKCVSVYKVSIQWARGDLFLADLRRELAVRTSSSELATRNFQRELLTRTSNGWSPTETFNESRVSPNAFVDSTMWRRVLFVRIASRSFHRRANSQLEILPGGFLLLKVVLIKY